MPERPATARPSAPLTPGPLFDAAGAAGELRTLLGEPEAGARARRASLLERTSTQKLESGAQAPVLFGAGRLGRKIARGLRELGSPAVAFADNSPALWNTEVDGLPVLPPAEAAAQHGATSPFVVSIWSPGHRFLATRGELEALGCACVVPFQTIVWRHPEVLLPHFFFDVPERILARRDDLERAFEMLADDRSRAEFVAHLRWRLWLDFDALPPPAGPDTYFCGDPVRRVGDELLVDCGAFDGDTLAAFVRVHGHAFRGAVAYEPDPSTLLRLREAVANLPTVARARVDVRHAAVAGHDGMVRFASDGAMHSAISDAGDVRVRAVTLDRDLAGTRPTYIKMDIEGAELEALRAAAEIVRASHPVLAVCTDHRPEDLWAIPRQIAAFGVPYRHYFRTHDDEGFDTVWYAVPPHRATGGGQ